MNFPSIRQLVSTLFRSRYLVQLELENKQLRSRVFQLESQGEQVMSNLLIMAGGPGIHRDTAGDPVPNKIRASAPSIYLRARAAWNRKNPSTIDPADPTISH